jgi:hypothetical protein
MDLLEAVDDHGRRHRHLVRPVPIDHPFAKFAPTPHVRSVAGEQKENNSKLKGRALSCGRGRPAFQSFLLDTRAAPSGLGAFLASCRSSGYQGGARSRARS